MMKRTLIILNQVKMTSSSYRRVKKLFKLSLRTKFCNTLDQLIHLRFWHEVFARTSKNVLLVQYSFIKKYKGFS